LPVLGRFISADSIVPGAGNPQAFNRYSYALSNPLKYIDPSGHKYCDAENLNDCSRYSNSVEDVARMYGIRFTAINGAWTLRNKVAVISAVEAVGRKLAQDATLDDSPSRAFRAIYHGVTFVWDTQCVECQGGGGYTAGPHKIIFASLSRETVSGGGYRSEPLAFTDARNNVVHELGHAFGQKWYVWDPNAQEIVYRPDGPYLNIPSEMQNNEGFHPSPSSARLTWRQHPCTAADTGCAGETFADMFLGWTFGAWANSPEGQIRDAFMTTKMPEWIESALSLP
jgi:hypothetical protein